MPCALPAEQTHCDRRSRRGEACASGFVRQLFDKAHGWVERMLPIIVVPMCLSALSTAASSQPICRPQLAVKDARLSQMVGSKRYWWAGIEVDASTCVETSGRFEIWFSRIKEAAPDVEFREPLTWQAGTTDAVVEFAVDEAVQAYRVGYVSPCTCRK